MTQGKHAQNLNKSTSSKMGTTTPVHDMHINRCKKVKLERLPNGYPTKVVFLFKLRDYHSHSHCRMPLMRPFEGRNRNNQPPADNAAVPMGDVQ